MSNSLSGEKVLKIAMRGYKDIIPVNWHGEVINVRYILPLSEEIDLIGSIINCCVDKSDGCLHIELIELSLMSNIVETYTSIKLPSDIDDRHRMLYHSNLYKAVSDAANQTQINNIVNVVNMYIRQGVLGDVPRE